MEDRLSISWHFYKAPANWQECHATLKHAMFMITSTHLPLPPFTHSPPIHPPHHSPPTPQAVKRWFDDTYTEATRGDVKQQALLGQMYAEGDGCEKDPKAAAEWTQRAGNRGYKMQGVYCEL